jgi:spermidine/putrescine transport system ATP-binding protein
MKIAEIELKNVLKKYGNVVAVNECNLSINTGEFLALLGPSGCGKTTLLRLIAGYEEVSRGDIFIRGKKVNHLPANQRNIGMVFQSYALFPHMRVAQNVAFGLRMQKIPKNEIKDRVEEVLELTRCQELGHRYPNQLSGGQQQRVALARAIVIKPDVLALDEPLGALDKKLRKELQVELRNLHQSIKTTTIFVTHDQEEALALADRTVVMRKGIFEQVGNPKQIYKNPKSKFVAEFIGTSNFFEGKIDFLRDGKVGIQIGESTIVAKGSDYDLGQDVALTIRPEKIILSEQQIEESNSFQCTVENVIYLGSETHYYLSIPGHKKHVIAFIQNNQEKKTFTAKESAYISWQVEDTYVLTN